MITITPKAIAKIKYMKDGQLNGTVTALRLGVQGGGCSGLNYVMQFEKEKGPLDKEYWFDGLKVLVDGTSAMYLDGVTVDYVETLMESGFKFNNPLATRTCGCGSSFSV